MDTKSKALFEQAKEIIPGGVNSPVRAFQAVNRTPRFIDHAKGDRIFDVDGNEMIDYICSWGPMILGHENPEVIKAIKESVDKGLTYGAPTANEVKLAELIKELVPSMEMNRLVSSGTEAVMSCIRVARGYTGKDKIIKFRGNYHGHSDGLLVKAGSGALTTAVPDSAGVPSSFTEHTLVAEYNNEDSVSELFKKYHNQIAAVIVEPVAANMGVVLPSETFLPFLRKITKENDALLIFDEVITGFRLGTSGAQGYYGVTPDMTTLGKIVGGGMPIGAYGGRKEIMQQVSPVGPVYQAGTLSGNPVATAAGIKTLEILKDHPEIYTFIDKQCKKLEDAFKLYGKGKVSINRAGSLMSVFFCDTPVTDYDSAKKANTDKYAEYFGYMLDHNIYIAPSQFEAMFVSWAHSDEDIDKTIAVIKGYFEEH